MASDTLSRDSVPKNNVILAKQEGVVRLACQIGWINDLEIISNASFALTVPSKSC